MDNPESFRGTLLLYLNVASLSESTSSYIEKLCTAAIVWIAGSFTQKPTLDHVCDVLTTLLGMGVATPYISRVRDIATKFDEYYADRNKHTEIFMRPNRILGIEIEMILHTYYYGGTLDLYQYLIVILEQILDEIRGLLEIYPNSSNEEIINYILRDVSNRDELIANIDTILTQSPI